MPYPCGAFDLVFMGLVLTESDAPLKVLSEARRVTRNRVGILEWAYHDESFGPPPAHRVAPEALTQWLFQVGFSNAKTLPLAHLVFYGLTA